MERGVKNKAASVRARLINIARAEKIDFDFLLLRYFSDEEKQKQWNAFLRKSRLHDINQEFNEIVERITSFLKPIVDSTKNKDKVDKIWDAIAGCWKK